MGVCGCCNLQGMGKVMKIIKIRTEYKTLKTRTKKQRSTKGLTMSQEKGCPSPRSYSSLKGSSIFIGFQFRRYGFPLFLSFFKNGKKLH